MTAIVPGIMRGGVGHNVPTCELFLLATHRVTNVSPPCYPQGIEVHTWLEHCGHRQLTRVG